MKDVDDMAASLVIEEDTGIYRGLIRHSHNGYCSGSFETLGQRTSGRTPAPLADAQPGSSVAGGAAGADRWL